MYTVYDYEYVYCTVHFTIQLELLLFYSVVLMFHCFAEVGVRGVHGHFVYGSVCLLSKGSVVLSASSVDVDNVVLQLYCMYAWKKGRLVQSPDTAFMRIKLCRFCMTVIHCANTYVHIT